MEKIKNKKIKNKMLTQKITGSNGSIEDKEIYEFSTFQSDSRENKEIDFKKEAKKIYTFISDHISGGTGSEIKTIYEKELTPVDTRFVSILKTNKECQFCNCKIKIGELVYFERMFKPYKHFKIMHSMCSLNHWVRRLKENIEADAPQIIIDDYCEIIGNIYSKILKETIKNKHDISPFIFKN